MCQLTECPFPALFPALAFPPAKAFPSLGLRCPAFRSLPLSAIPKAYWLLSADKLPLAG